MRTFVRSHERKRHVRSCSCTSLRRSFHNNFTARFESNLDRYGNTLAPQDTFDPNVQIFVHRATASGYEPVAFELVDQPGLVPNARQILLADPVPGQYVVSSPQVTCVADPSPAGIGLHVGSFELEPAVSLPTSLGELHWLGEDSVAATYEAGPNATCQIIEIDLRVTHSRFESGMTRQRCHGPMSSMPRCTSMASSIADTRN